MDYLLDVNVLIALKFARHPHYERAQLFVQSLDGQDVLLVSRSVQQGFVRLITTKSLFQSYGLEQYTNRDAVIDLNDIMSRPNLRFIPEPIDIETLWLTLASSNTPSPKVWMDAYLAAFAILRELVLVSLDTDFKQYVDHGLKIELL